MAGRGTDIILGGNPEGLAKAEADPLKEAEANAQAFERYRVKCAEERENVLAAGASTSWAPNATRHAASTTNCAAGRGVRGTQEPPGSISRWKMICCAFSVLSGSPE
jgi:preprotein translocase subunit SecA